MPGASALPKGLNIALVGLMGVGKTTVGRRLAARLGLTFVDADDEIEKAAACPISEIFERFGEAGFRDGERRVIRRILEQGGQVLATGGGAFVDEQTRAVIQNQAVSIWLTANLDTLVSRTARSNHRPLLAKSPDRRATLAELLEARSPAYAQADLTVESAPGPAERTVDRVVAALETYFLDHERVEIGE